MQDCTRGMLENGSILTARSQCYKQNKGRHRKNTEAANLGFTIIAFAVTVLLYLLITATSSSVNQQQDRYIACRCCETLQACHSTSMLVYNVNNVIKFFTTKAVPQQDMSAN